MREQAEKELDQENELGTKRPPLGIPTPSAGSSDLLPWFRPTGFHFFESVTRKMRFGNEVLRAGIDTTMYVSLMNVSL